MKTNMKLNLKCRTTLKVMLLMHKKYKTTGMKLNVLTTCFSYIRLLLKCKTKCNHVHYIHILKLRHLAPDTSINSLCLDQSIIRNASIDGEKGRGRTKKQSEGMRGMRVWGIALRDISICPSLKTSLKVLKKMVLGGDYPTELIMLLMEQVTKSGMRREACSSWMGLNIVIIMGEGWKEKLGWPY